ncbi:MAG: TVP38/TMEM64 family protein [bacterium]
MGSENSASEKKSQGLWRPIALIGAVIVVLILTKVFGLGDKISALKGWIDSLGVFGPVVFTALYIVAVVAALPGSVLTVGAGALFGSILGIILVSIGSTIGAALSFLIARYFARESAAKWLQRNEKFKKLDQMTEEHGAIMVAITRLVPAFPFNLLNYGFGLTKVPFWTYVLWSWMCMLPGTVLFVVGADAFTQGIEQGRVPWGLVAAVAAALAVLGFLVKAAKNKLKN